MHIAPDCGKGATKGENAMQLAIDNQTGLKMSAKDTYVDKFDREHYARVPGIIYHWQEAFLNHIVPPLS